MTSTSQNQEEWITQANVYWFEQLLREAKDERTREKMLYLLAAEQKRLNELKASLG